VVTLAAGLAVAITTVKRIISTSPAAFHGGVFPRIESVLDDVVDFMTVSPFDTNRSIIRTLAARTLIVVEETCSFP
jgi:hypothetical protein